MTKPVERLVQLRGELAALDPSEWSNVETWIAAAKPVVRVAFPDHLADFDDACKKPHWVGLGRVSHGGGFFGESPPVDNHAEAEREEGIINGRKRAEARDRILACLDALLALAPASAPAAPLDRLLAMLTRFPAVVRRLQTRPKDRAPLAVSDEYDVQYILYALLTAEFDDVRSEDVACQRAGAASRVDFVLKPERIIIEAKYARQDHTSKKLGDELIVDKERYRAHPDYGTLVCFVYDPNHVLPNPVGLERDLAEDSDRRVVVVVQPK